ncbi:MAG: hypothetical protein KIG32_07345 [Ruminiclostridium sp.]|nr:hypothetical protein [Ruminiclostridium sp.]
MADRFKIELDREGVRSLLRSEKALKVCSKYADAAVKKLGDGYEATEWVGKNRANASVAATTYDARRENSENNTILKAVYASD